MKPLDGPIQPGGGLTPQQKHLLEGAARMHAVLRQGRALPGLPDGEKPDFDLHERRLDEIEALIRSGRREDALRLAELHEVFMLDFQADAARVMAGVSERMVRTLDKVAHRHEAVKFELTGAERESMEEEVIEPYKDQFREAMLGSLPIAKRRALEEEQRRLQAGDEPQS